MSFKKDVIKNFVRAWGGKDCYEMGILPLLVMPTPYKPFHEMTYGELKVAWKEAYNAIENAEEAVSCGFSFADQHFNQVLSEATRKRGKALPLTIVNRSENSYREIKKRINDCKVNLTPYTGGIVKFGSSL